LPLSEEKQTQAHIPENISLCALVM